MKKTYTVLLAAVLLAGCTTAKPQESAKPETTPEPTQETTPEPTQETVAETNDKVGAWETNSEFYRVDPNEEDMDRFAKVTAELTGVGYTALTVVAEQLVSGTNYAYLALGEMITGSSEFNYYIVTVYQPQEGDPEILNIAKIDLDDLHLGVEDADVVGGWEVRGSGRPGSLGEDGEYALSRALEGHEGVLHMPIALLGQQLVSGTNYKYLTYGTEDDNTSLYVLEVYQDLDGNCEITQEEKFDLNWYVTPEN